MKENTQARAAKEALADALSRGEGWRLTMLAAIAGLTSDDVARQLRAAEFLERLGLVLDDDRWDAYEGCARKAYTMRELLALPFGHHRFACAYGMATRAILGGNAGAWIKGSVIEMANARGFRFDATGWLLESRGRPERIGREKA